MMPAMAVVEAASAGFVATLPMSLNAPRASLRPRAASGTTLAKVSVSLTGDQSVLQSGATDAAKNVELRVRMKDASGVLPERLYLGDPDHSERLAVDLALEDAIQSWDVCHPELTVGCTDEP